MARSWSEVLPPETFDLYGYWPTLQDPVITQLDVVSGSREAELTLYYADRPERAQHELTIRMRLRAAGLTRLDLVAPDPYDFAHAALSDDGDALRLEFWGAYARLGLCAERFEAHLDRVDCLPPDDVSFRATWSA